MALLNANQINSGASLPYASEPAAHVRGSKGVVSHQRLTGAAANTNIALGTGTNNGRLDHFVEVASGGSGYTQGTHPLVIDAPPTGGVQAAGTLTVDANGVITNAELTNRGRGYRALSPPNITPNSAAGNGSGATLRARVSETVQNERSEIIGVYYFDNAGSGAKFLQDVTHFVNEGATDTTNIQLTIDTSSRTLIVVHQHFQDIT